MKPFMVSQVESGGIYPEDAVIKACGSAHELYAAADRIRSMMLSEQSLVDKYCVLGWQARGWRAEKPWADVRHKVLEEVAGFIEADMRARVRVLRHGLDIDTFVDALVPFSIESLLGDSLKAALNGIDWEWIADHVVMGELDKLAERELHNGI
jgi:hypothetical protein